MAMSWTHNAAWPRRATLQPELSSPRVMLPHAALADVEPKPGRAASAGLPTELPPAMSPIDAGSIIAGTAIGGGFLALPYVTTPVGYLTSVCGLVAVWVFLLSAALALIEAAGLVADEQLQVREDDASAAGDAPSAEFTLSVATVIRHVFGPRAATMAGGAFMAQMLAVMTAQVVKGAEILAKFTPMSYHLGCVAPAALVGLFTFSARPKVVERANTGLTVAMLAGFGALIAAAVSLGGGAAARVALARADWPLLLPLPSAGTAWAIPVFINLLCFGQVWPVSVRMRMCMCMCLQQGARARRTIHVLVVHGV